MIWETLSTSSAETESLGELLGRQLKGGEVLELVADLGGGKTTFVKGLVRGAGGRSMVTSPTFTLSNVYPVKNLQIHHYDFYRLDDAGVLRDQLKESLDEPKTVIVVEWSGIVKDALPEKRIRIELKVVNGNSEERQITITYSEKNSDIITQAETSWQETRP